MSNIKNYNNSEKISSKKENDKYYNNYYNINNQDGINNKDKKYNDQEYDNLIDNNDKFNKDHKMDSEGQKIENENENKNNLQNENDKHLKMVKFPIFKIFVYSLFGLLLGIVIEVSVSRIEPHITSLLFNLDDHTSCTKRALIHISIGIVLLLLMFYIVLKVVECNITDTFEGLFFSTMVFIPLTSFADSIKEITNQCIDKNS